MGEEVQEQVTAILLGARSLFIEGVAATLVRGSYRVERRFALADHASLHAYTAAARLLIIIVRSGLPDLDRTCASIRSIRSVLPRAKIICLREFAAVPEQSYHRIEADALIQCALDPQALLSIAAFVLSGSYKLFVTSSAPSPRPSEQQVDAAAHGGQPSATRVELLLGSLSKREREILGGLARGETNKTLARRLDLSEATIKAHVRAVLQKIGVANRTQAAVMLLDSGLYAKSV